MDWLLIKWGLAATMFVAPFLVTCFATRKDIEMWKNPETRKKVVEEFDEDMGEREIAKKFAYTNMRELSLFYGGLIAGLLIGGALP